MLNDILTLDIYRFFMIVTRLGAAMLFMPGFAGQLLPVRSRLLLTLALALVLLPIAGPIYPPLPRRLGGLFLLMMGETMVGLYLGILTQVMLSALNVAGTFISFQVGLTNAFSFDAVAEQQSSLLTSFFTNLGLMAIFATDLHHLMLRALVDSYGVFVPGEGMPLGDFSESLGHLISVSFGFGIKLASPLVAFGLIFYGALGLVSRLTPQVQVFFIAMPLQVVGGLWMLMVALPLMLMLFLRGFEDGLIPFLSQR